MTLHPEIAAVLAGESDGCVVQGDSLAIMGDMPDGCVDLVFADPPYNIGKAAWDKVPDYLAWCEKWIAECSRVLKPNGAFWISHSKPLVLAKLSEMVAAHGRGLRNWVTWDKSPWSYVDKLYKEAGTRAFIDANEYLVYHADEGEWTAQSDKTRGFIFEPLRAYLAGERDRAGISNSTINAAWCELKGVNSTSQTQKWFSQSCFNPPTQEAYEWLRRLFNANGGEYLRREYEYLRREYEDLRREYESLRYTFNNPGKMSSVWQIPPATPNGHPTPKPEELLKRIIEATSSPGGLIMDPFCGSGTTPAMCARLGRHCVAVDVDEKYVAQTHKRLSAEARPLFTEAQVRQPEPTLFGGEQ